MGSTLPVKVALLFVLFVWCIFFPVGKEVHLFCFRHKQGKDNKWNNMICPIFLVDLDILKYLAHLFQRIFF